MNSLSVGAASGARRPVLLALCAFTLVAVATSACSRTPRPDDTVTRFLRAANEKDVNGMLGCVDPKQERMFRASFRIVEKVTGGLLPVEDLLEMVPGLLGLFQNQLGEDFSFRDVQVRRGTVKGEGSEVMVVLTLWQRSRGSEKTDRRVLWFALRRFDDVGWRITGIRS